MHLNLMRKNILQLNNKGESKMENISKEELIKVITHLLDGNYNWREIQEFTGLPEQRCKEIENIGKKCINYTYNNIKI